AIYVPPMVTEPEAVAAPIARSAGALPDDQPIATVFLSSNGTPAVLSSGPRGAIPSYSFPEHSALALIATAPYRPLRQPPGGSQLRLEPEREQAVRACLRGWATAGPDKRWLTFPEVAQLLLLAGVPVVEHHTARDPEAAVEAARALGFPVAVKASVPKLVHK